jgi:hypothetical protein
MVGLPAEVIRIGVGAKIREWPLYLVIIYVLSIVEKLIFQYLKVIKLPQCEYLKAKNGN